MNLRVVVGQLFSKAGLLEQGFQEKFGELDIDLDVLVKGKANNFPKGHVEV
jgi:hypothetical protein